MLKKVLKFLKSVNDESFQYFVTGISLGIVILALIISLIAMAFTLCIK